MNLFIKFIAGFAALGLLISVVAGFLGGNRWTAVLVTALICTILSAGLGAATYKVLEMRVPEFLALFQGAGGEEELAPDFDEDALAAEEGFAAVAADDAPAPADDAGPDTKSFGDHILVNKVKIKNEPRLMAQAIRTMLAKDEE